MSAVRLSEGEEGKLKSRQWAQPWTCGSRMRERSFRQNGQLGNDGLGTQGLGHDQTATGLCGQRMWAKGPWAMSCLDREHEQTSG